MARRKKHEDHVNHEAWAIPYGDLVTLLLAFFVVMYAMSSVNEGKYRVLSDSLVAAFRSAPKSLEPIQVGQPSKSKHELQTSTTRTLVPIESESTASSRGSLKEQGLGPGQGPGQGQDEGAAVESPLGGDARYDYLRSGEIPEQELSQAADLIEDLMGALSKELGELVEKDLVRLRQDRYWLEIEINTSVLFDSASAELSPDARTVLQQISSILAGTATRVMIEGHTDNRPISTVVYPSNWELSAARAANVVRLFEGAGLEPARMGAVGFGEFRPVADNGSPDGQRRNRRIVIAVIAYQPEGVRGPWNGLGAAGGQGSAGDQGPAGGAGSSGGAGAMSVAGQSAEGAG